MVAFGDNNFIEKQSLDVAQGLLKNKLVVSDTFARYSDDLFFGRDGDTISLRIEKPLPAPREYALNNERIAPIEMDFMDDTKVDLEVSEKRIYSAVGVREEVRDFRLDGTWGRTIAAQTQSMSSGYEKAAQEVIEQAPFEYVKHVDYSDKAIKDAAALGQDALFNALSDARTALTKMTAPGVIQGGYALAGSAWANAFRKNQKLELAKTNNSSQAFADASLGVYAGFSIIESERVADDELLLYTGDAFLHWNAAPSFSASVKAGGTVNKDGLSMRWILDYDPNYLVDRSIFTSYTAFGYSKDFVEALDTTNQVRISEDQFFIRGAKLILGGSAANDILPGNGKGKGKGASPDSYLAIRYNNGRVAGVASKSIYADLTYQNIVDGTVGLDDGKGNLREGATPTPIDPEGAPNDSEG